jgi:hypothetical protein
MTTYSYTPLDPNAIPAEMNNAETIALTRGPNYLNATPYLEQGDIQTSIMQPGWGQSALVYDINDNGLAVGTYYDLTNYYGAQGFIYDSHAGTWQRVFDPSATSDGPNNGETTVSGINDNGIVVGLYTTGSIEHGYEYNSNTGVYTTLDDPRTNHNTNLIGINDAGQVIDSYYGLDGVSHYGLENNGVWSTFTDPNAANNSTTVTQINDQGLVSGFYTDSSGHNHGFIYNIANASYTDFNYPGATDTILSGINNNGTLVGGAQMPDGSNGEFFATSVPPAVSFIGPVVDAAADTTWPVTVSGTGGETGTLVFSDTAGHSASVNVTGDGKYLANLSSLVDGPISSTLTLSDSAGNTQSVSGGPLTLVGAPLPNDAHVTLSPSSTGNLGKVGTDSPSVIDGSQTSNVTFSTGNGPDTIVAGPNDIVHAGTGHDTVVGANGATLYAGGGPETLFGAPSETLAAAAAQTHSPSSLVPVRTPSQTFTRAMMSSSSIRLSL